MNFLKINKITPVRKDKVWDIHHNISSKQFYQQHPNLLVNQLLISNCSRHAGGVVIGEDLDRHMPLIKSGGVTQTPWSEGQNVRHLEPLGFIKFDFLGLGTLRMMQDAIELILRRHHGMESPTFADIKDYYDNNLHPAVIDFDDQRVYKNVFHKGNFAGVFQFQESGMQSFAKQAKPTSLIDLTALTSIWRPGPLEAKVHVKYLKVKHGLAPVSYDHPILEKTTLNQTYGFLIFQEQIAEIAQLVGKNITADEGNALRKLLTKKGIGSVGEKKQKIFEKFKEGALEKGVDNYESIWKTMEAFSQYAFNKSHALSYSIVSFQTAWLLTYYPAEWLCGFMNAQGEDKKEKGIAIVRSLGYDVLPIDIEKSGIRWEPDTEGKSLVQPLYTLKGMGQKAMEKIVEHRPYNNIEEMLFGDKKIGKKELDVLIRIGALEHLRDESVFRTRKAMWWVCAENKPTTKKKFNQSLLELSSWNDGEFTIEEDIEAQVAITGVFPFDLLVSQEIKATLEKNGVPPLSDLKHSGLAWFVPRAIKPKKTKNGKDYWIVEVIDLFGKVSSIKCWGVKPTESIEVNKAYMGNVQYDEKWGYSVRSIKNQLKKI